MTTLLSQAFQEAEKLSDAAQNEIGQQLLVDITNELAWQHCLSSPELRIDALEHFAALALAESDAKRTQRADCAV